MDGAISAVNLTALSSLYRKSNTPEAISVKSFLAQPLFQASKPFQLCKLPAELRNKVYLYALSEESIHYPHLKKRRFYGLLRSCNQIYHEALPYCFRYTFFCFDTASALLRFLRKIGPIARANLTGVQLYWLRGPLDDAVECFKLLARCVSLTNLWVFINEAELVREEKNQSLISFQEIKLREVKGMHELRLLQGVKRFSVFGYSSYNHDHDGGFVRFFQDDGFRDWLKEGIMKSRGGLSEATSVATKHFKFLELPSELRNHIYDYAFHEPDWIDVPSNITRRQGSYELLRVSNQIYYEALPLCYRHTKFYVRKEVTLVDFLKKIGPIARTNITILELEPHRISCGRQAYRLLGMCSRLADLSFRPLIELSGPRFDQIGRRVKELDDVRSQWGLKKVDLQNGPPASPFPLGRE